MYTTSPLEGARRKIITGTGQSCKGALCSLPSASHRTIVILAQWVPRQSSMARARKDLLPLLSHVHSTHLPVILAIAEL